MIVVYRDQDQEWWVAEQTEYPKMLGALENLPEWMVESIVALQHAPLRTALDGVGVRVGTNKYWLVPKGL
jgi:dsDNA-binding SOS-regulon protein